MAKKYYWLKLKRDFFKRHDIRIIEDMDNGKDYILFYLKLLVESIDHDGHLRFSDTIPYNDKMLATITNTNIDIVRTALKIFSELGFIDVLDDETIYMNQITEMIGYETKWAEKKRKQRNNAELSEETEDNVPLMSPECPQNVPIVSKDDPDYVPLVSNFYEDNVRQEKELEKELEKDNNTLPALQSERKQLSKMKDPLSNHYQNLFVEIYPDSGWGDFGKERKQLDIIAGKTKTLFNENVPFENEYQFSEAIIKKFLSMKQSGFWKAKDKPVTPSSLSACWAEVIDGLIKDHVQSQPFEEVEIF